MLRLLGCVDCREFQSVRSRLRRSSPHGVLACYAVKAAGNLGLLRLLAQAGAGFDIVSGGELVIGFSRLAEILARRFFSGVGKTAEEIDAALAAGVGFFNCESEPELAVLDALAHRSGGSVPAWLYA